MMADYYPVLARAVSRLQDNDARARQELYKRARTIADAQLLGQDLQRSAPQILRERASLEAAIRRVETEFLYLSSHSSTGPPAPRPSAAVADNGHDVGVRQKRSMRDEATARPPPAQYADRDTDTGKSPTTNVTVT